jgi:hypothetical protein
MHSITRQHIIALGLGKALTRPLESHWTQFAMGPLRPKTSLRASVGVAFGAITESTARSACQEQRQVPGCVAVVRAFF